MKKLITISLMLAGCLSLLPAAASAQEIKNPYAPWNRRKVLERDNKKGGSNEKSYDEEGTYMLIGSRNGTVHVCRSICRGIWWFRRWRRRSS